MKLAIFGTGGFAKEVLDLAIDQDYTDIVFLDRDVNTKKMLLGFPVLDESEVGTLEQTHFIIGIADPKIRKDVFLKYPNLFYPSLIHTKASIGYGMRDKILAQKGCIIASGATITNSSIFGDFNIISFNSTVGHDCILNDFISIMPGVNLSGNVNIAELVYIGTGASILPGSPPSKSMCLEESSIIGAGAVVVTSTQSKKTYVGIPAKEI